MSVFSKLKQFQELREQAKKIEDVLSAEKIEVETAGGQVKLAMNGKQEIIYITIDPALLQPGQKERMEGALKQAFNDAVHKVQKIMATKIQSMGGLNLPGMK